MTLSERIRAEILALTDKEGLVHADDMYQWARTHKNSALHTQFEWDVEQAAREHWREQARRLIKLHVVDMRGRPEMVSLSVDRTHGGGYRQVAHVLESRELSAVMLEDALRDLKNMQERYSLVAELVSVWEEAERVRARTPKRPKKVAENRVGA